MGIGWSRRVSSVSVVAAEKVEIGDGLIGASGMLQKVVSMPTAIWQIIPAHTSHVASSADLALHPYTFFTCGEAIADVGRLDRFSPLVRYCRF